MEEKNNIDIEAIEKEVDKIEQRTNEIERKIHALMSQIGVPALDSKGDTRPIEELSEEIINQLNKLPEEESTQFISEFMDIMSEITDR